ncbi:CRM-domain containing factor CFM2, chloroplastic isoform X2 [Medicago truncatula]|uniref:CRM-domain containing factor CFM2, chloroplastic isoform X2 n=1 Tax=Medicago truncatula TaxID=3880 RepID=UPI0019687C5A|nr:CRM-domain containing factor CFM2, chloroplastic isoform X2 [Medicago truncatula]
MLLPTTNFNTFFTPSSPFFFPFHFPKTPSKFTIRTSSSNSHTLPDSAIQRIADKLHSLGIITTTTGHSSSSSTTSTTTAGEIFLPLPHTLPKYRVGHTLDLSWSTPENPVPLVGAGLEKLSENEVERARLAKEKKREEKRKRVPTLAELSLTDGEILRLRELGYQMKQKIKVGKAGVTEGIVNGIHERWRRSEVVRVVCEDLCRINMKRTHDILERKTGGLVVWRSGSKIILYRGIDYKYPYFLSDEVLREEESDALQPMDSDDESIDERKTHSSEMSSATHAGQSSNIKTVKPALVQGVGTPNRVRFQLPGEAELLEEVDSLLEGLGPRFTDWWGYDPVPVDADLLPAVIPGFRPPFRLLPYGVQSKLTDDEMTTLKRLGRTLPCHFALGRNWKLQGVAAAIIKFWERCEIVNIAVKRGVQNTSNRKMAEEIKYLTGGTLLSRNKEVIVIYRGKDFLPAAVSSAIKKRWKAVKNKENAENRSAITASSHSERKHMTFIKDKETIEKPLLMKAKAAIQRTSFKLAQALEKKEKAEKLLESLEKDESLQEEEIDKESITEEERYMLRRIGLKMKPFLLLGRRGVFDGTVENMHLHWKYRELVKIICNQESVEYAHQTARTLEAESGGILVAVERVNKGYAIIVYRGKNYSRPDSLRPRTLLNKKQALKRSIEAQRREALKLHVLKLDKNINELKHQMVKDEASSEQIAKELRSDLATENSPEEASVDNQQPIQEQHIELIGSGGECQGEPESLTGLVHQERQLDEVDDFVVDTGHSVSTNKASEGSIISFKSDPEPSAPVINENSNEFPSSLVHPKRQLDEVSDSVVDTGHSVSTNDAMEASIISFKRDPEPSAPVINKSPIEFSSRSSSLSNRERLLLRKQALRMKKIPIVPIGKSNIVAGLEEAIKNLLRRHPFVIVNVKGRAKGTSVHELVSILEEATGAVLVSQEPSKIILYRGWGAGTQRHTNSIYRGVAEDGGAKPNVSPELLEAIRIECGLQ